MAALAVALATVGANATVPPQSEDEPSVIGALLEHAWEAESAPADASDRHRALALYCQAGLAGSPEGYFRVGLLLVDGPADVRDVARGRAYLGLAAQLGHERAASLLDDVPVLDEIENGCAGFEPPSLNHAEKFSPAGRVMPPSLTAWKIVARKSPAA